jgi:hypothetical protein
MTSTNWRCHNRIWAQNFIICSTNLDPFCCHKLFLKSANQSRLRLSLSEQDKLKFYNNSLMSIKGHDIIILDLSSTGECVLLVLTFGIPTVLMKLNTEKCIWCTQSLLVSLIFIATAI